MNKSQQKLILEHLLQGYTITQVDAIREYRCYRLSAIIKILRNAGYYIVTHQEKNTSNHAHHARYELIGEQS